MALAALSVSCLAGLSSSPTSPGMAPLSPNAELYSSLCRLNALHSMLHVFTAYSADRPGDICRTCCLRISHATRHGFANACNALQGASSAECTGHIAEAWSRKGILAVARGNISNVAGNSNVAVPSTAHMACSEETVRAAAAMLHAETDWQVQICRIPFCRQWASSLDLLGSDFLLSLIA